MSSFIYCKLPYRFIKKGPKKMSKNSIQAIKKHTSISSKLVAELDLMTIKS